MKICDELGSRNVLRCGRRYGKTTFLETVFGYRALLGEEIGWFTPDYKLMRPTYNRLHRLLKPAISHSSKTESKIELANDGSIEFWTLDNEDAGRSRKYDHVIIDEASLIKKGLKEIIQQAISPTLLDKNGTITIAGTPKGNDPENYFYVVCTNKKLGYKEFHLPTAENPLLNRKAIADLPNKYPPLVYQQEFLALFVDWSGDAFFVRDKLLYDGKPVQYPNHCDMVVAVIDSATKTGKENDGTAVIYLAYTSQPNLTYKLVILDWDVSQIQGAMLEAWLPNVFTRAQELATTCGARHGVGGVWIEDKASGMVLLQQAMNRNMNVHAIDSKLTSVGKSERAISVSGYVHQNLVKLSEYAFNKITNYKGVDRNHLLSQVVGFRIGVKDQIDDDLLDTFCYGIAITLGNSGGF